MNKRLTILALLVFIVTGNAFSQQPSRVSIKGMIKDGNNNEGAFATVMLLNPKDSTLQNFTQSNEHGVFAFNNVKNTDYILKVSLISFLPLQMLVQASPTAVNDLGTVAIKPIAKELFEVVIREAKAPLTIRGDTIEYDATTFKAPPGSTVEDLLRRLPGIEVDASGNLKTQGKDVKRVYVDGKTFFGDDPKGATKNLDANAVSKVQVFDEKSEQSKLTGVDDGVKEKAMNLELKEEFKKGSFGKLTAAGGIDENGGGHWAGRGNFNRFNKTSQLSFIAYGNNINETGVNWEDYSEFKGQSTFDERDNGDFGFNSGGGRYFSYGDDGSPISYFDGRGFTKNYGGGVNYNFDNKKTKFNSSYFYKNNRQIYEELSFKETFYGDSSFFNNDTSNYSDNRQNHTVAFRIEQNLDSNNVIIAKANFRYSTINSANQMDNLYTLGNDTLLNSLYRDNSLDKGSWKLSSTAIYRHKFRKKGRSFAISAAYNRNPVQNDEDLYSLNRFYIPYYTEEIHRRKNENIDKQQIKSSVLFTESLSKRFFLELFDNFNTSDNKDDRQVNDALQNDIRVDSLSVYYSNKVMINRLGTDVRYSYNGLNIMLGIAGQYLQLNGRYLAEKGGALIVPAINKTYWSLSPQFDFTYQFPNNMYLSVNYGYNVTEPSFEYLQPVPNVSNPLYQTEGNIDLKPERTHELGFYYSYYNPASFAYAGINTDYSYCANKITYNQNLMMVDSIGIITVSKPDNNSKSNTINTYSWIGFPLIKTKLTNNWHLGFYYGNSGARVNDVFNKTQRYRYSLSTSLDITPGSKIVIALSGNASLNKTAFSINTDRNQLIQEYSCGLSVKWQFARKSFFESNFDYEFNRNSLYDYDKSFPLFNASVRQLLGKKNRFEIRLAAFDILNKKQYVVQYASQNYYLRSTAETLTRYYMLSLSYNIKGYETKIKKDRGW